MYYIAFNQCNVITKLVQGFSNHVCKCEGEPILHLESRGYDFHFFSLTLDTMVHKNIYLHSHLALSLLVVHFYKPKFSNGAFNKFKIAKIMID